MPCNAFIQPHVYYASPSWYPNLSENKNKKGNNSYARIYAYSVAFDLRKYIIYLLWKQNCEFGCLLLRESPNA